MSRKSAAEKETSPVEEPVPITGSDFLEVCHCGSECAQPVLLLCHRLQQPLILLLEGGHSTLLGIGEQVSGLMQPSVRLSDRGQSCSVRLVRLARAAAVGSVRREAPFFRDPPDRVVDGPQSLFQLESVSIQRRFPIIGECAPDCQAVAAHCLGFCVCPPF